VLTCGLLLYVALGVAYYTCFVTELADLAADLAEYRWAAWTGAWWPDRVRADARVWLRAAGLAAWFAASVAVFHRL